MRELFERLRFWYRTTEFVTVGEAIEYVRFYRGLMKRLDQLEKDIRWYETWRTT